MSSLKTGDKVRIIDSKKKSDVLYNIKKIKKSQDGTTLFLLKAEASTTTLLYYEDKDSHLEKTE